MSDKVTKSTRQRHDGFGPQKRRLFLEAYRRSANISAACKHANIDRRTYYVTLEKDAEFRQQVEEADQEATELLEAKAWSKAIQEGDNTSLWNLLKARRPEKYRDPVRRYARTDQDGNDIPEPTDEERVARLNAILESARERRDRQAD